MHGNINVQAILGELDHYGIKGEVNPRGKHVEVRWRVNGHERFYVTSATPSDWRGRLNCRADVRRMLKADAAHLPTPQAIVLQKAMALPSAPEKPDQRIGRLEKDVEGLLDIVSELQDQIKAVGVKLANVRVTATITFDPPTLPAQPQIDAKPTAALKRPKDFKRQRILEVMEAGKWVAVRELVPLVEDGQTDQAAQNRVGKTLLNLKKEGVVENGQRGWWRRVLPKA